jgi:hypothetical protein
MEGVYMKAPERPPSDMSCAELAWELSISQSIVLEMVRRKVLPEPVRLSPGCVRWTAVGSALAPLASTSDDSGPFIIGARSAIKTAPERSPIFGRQQLNAVTPGMIIAVRPAPSSLNSGSQVDANLPFPDALFADNITGSASREAMRPKPRDCSRNDVARAFCAPLDSIPESFAVREPVPLLSRPHEEPTPRLC